MLRVCYYIGVKFLCRRIKALACKTDSGNGTEGLQLKN